MVFPPQLHKGDRIGLVTPCSPLKPERVTQCIQAVENLGFQAVLGDSVARNLHGYLSGDDFVRANDLNQMFQDPLIHGIFCIRGGYGSTRIMDLLDYKQIAKNPKIFVGYSDVTSFHLAFQTRCKMVTFHGPMVSSNMVDDFDSYTQYSFLKAISMPPILSFTNPTDVPFTAIVPGQASGILIGGCLSLVAPSIGTFYEPNFHGKILFLEDIDESLPRCDKLMQQLKNSGVFEEVHGVILGNFIDCNNPNDSSYTMYDFFCDFFSNYDKPVLWGVQSGHGKPMGTLILGSICKMDATNGTLFFFH